MQRYVSSGMRTLVNDLDLDHSRLLSPFTSRLSSWKSIQASLASSVASVDLSGINKNLKNTVQSTRERFGQVDPNDVTE